MNRLNRLFETPKSSLLSIYFTAGYPDLNSTLDIAEALEKAGVDFIELGFPYSDPVADGPAIQHSSQKALDNGMNLKLLFEQLKGLRSRVSIPVILMGYINPVVQYGIKRFCEDASAVGVDGVILPDLPVYEYEQLYAQNFRDNNLSNIFMVTPQTSEERIREIDNLSNSFIYLLSAASVTGNNLKLSASVDTYFKRVSDMKLKNPTIVGFGINDKLSFDKACEYNRGAIIGTAFVKHTANENFLDGIKDFVNDIRVK